MFFNIYLYVSSSELGVLKCGFRFYNVLMLYSISLSVSIIMQIYLFRENNFE